MEQQRRVLIEWRRETRQLCKIGTKSDGSLYVIPYAVGSTYDFGVGHFPAGVAKATFEFRGQLAASKNPRVSIHESGDYPLTVGRFLLS